MEEGSEIEVDLAERVVTFRQCAQDVTELRSIEREAIDGDRDRALVVAEALEDGMQAPDIALGARDQAKRIHRGGGAQRGQLRRRLER